MKKNFLILFVLLSLTITFAQWTQHGPKLVGTGAVGDAFQGYSASISADGNTAIVGGYTDDNNKGAAWIFTRSNGIWTQQGGKLVGTGAIGNSGQGVSVSISADGNTAIVGGYGDNSFAGAAWIFTRSGSVWNQQGSKLVGTGVVGLAWQGISVSISSDGNTAIIGGISDNSAIGAAWIFTRNGSVWTQQGNKLVGNGAVGSSQQGSSVSLSSDGNTAIVGGSNDNNHTGAVWIFTRSDSIWTQQGSKLVGTGAVGSAEQGSSVSLSSDESTLIEGGWNDSNGIGAAWIFTRNDSVWTQQGNKLVGTDAVGEANQGISVSISSNGNTAIVGGDIDNSSNGAAWIFKRSGGLWTQQGSKLVGTGAIGAAEQGISVAISSDGNSAIIGGYFDNNGVGAVWIYTKPSLTLVEPHLDDLLIAEKPDTIKWTTDTLRNVEIYFSNDGDDNYSLITLVGEQDTFYVWNPPDNFHSSSNAEIKIVDALDASVSDVSDPFTYRTFDLIRRVSNQTLEVFTPPSNGWSFANEESAMWPPEWYQQFDYRNINDTVTNQPYRPDFIAITRPNPSDFPDWPLFVETFGVNKCYKANRPTQRAMEAWKTYKESWAGSCFGFPTSSLLAFEHLNDFTNQNPGIPVVSSIFNLFLTNTIRKTVNKYYLYQSDIAQIALIDISTFGVNPREFLSELKEMFLDETDDHRTISLQNNFQPGAHTLIPYKLIRDDVNKDQFRLYVYDCNDPGETGQFILIDSLANTWEEFLTIDYGIGTNGLFLNLPSSHFLQPPILSLLEDPTELEKLPNKTTLYITPTSSNFIISGNGDTLGYGEGRFLKQIPEGIPIIPFVAVDHPPIGYRVPEAFYKIQTKDFSDSISSLLIQKNGLIYSYERLDAVPSQSDILYLSEGLAVKNSDPGLKNINLESIVPFSSIELTYKVKFPLQNQDSMAIQVVNLNEFSLLNIGVGKSYDLFLRYLWNNGEINFAHEQIFLEGNTRHIVTPIDSIKNFVEILIDNGNNGTIDDTLIVDNTVGVEDQGSLLSPNSYNLAQNYPNPFNPVTTIQFSLPQAGDVTLKIYNVLGEEVKTLVNEYKEIGKHSVQFNANNLASGMYLYRIQAGSFLETKKMILLR